MDRYNEIKALVEKGVPVYKALKQLGINSSFFDRNVTKEQRRELQSIKTSFAKRGVNYSRKGLH